MLRICTILLIGLMGSAFAADNPAGDTTSSTKHADHKLTSEVFVRKASQDGMLEVEAGKLASSTSSDANIKAFGQRMVTDHSKANDELKSLVGSRYPIATQLDAEHQAKLDALSKKSGAEFDQAYVKDMMHDHTKAVKLFTDASTSSDVSADLQQFATKTLPVLKEHHKQVMKLSPSSAK
jgi:putative membrane protein